MLCWAMLSTSFSPTAFAHFVFVSPCDTFAKFHTFPLWLYLLWWAVISGLWCYHRNWFFALYFKIKIWTFFRRNAIITQLIDSVCLVAQSCPTLCNPVDCSPPGSSIRGILQARILQWVAMPVSRGSSQSRDRTQVSHIAGGFFTNWATRKPHE